MKSKEIENILNRYKVNFSYNEKGDILVCACEIGKGNFYDYGEKETPLNVNKKFSFLKTERKVKILRCCDCGKCSDW